MPAVAVRPLVSRADMSDVGQTFYERATQLVAFLVERHAEPGTPRRREQELSEWIACRRMAWRDAPALPFMPDELGIILRALNGPGDAHPAGERREHLCWLIARCMAQEN
jgi:hypothetical protein